MLSYDLGRVLAIRDSSSTRENNVSFFCAARFVGVKEVASFASLPQSFESMMYIVMFSNWPMFMDAAALVGNPVAAKIFFYSFKAIGFYFLFPVGPSGCLC